MAMHCPRCGAALRAGSSELELCAACLFAVALAHDRDRCPYEIVTPIAETSRSTTYLAQSTGSKRGYAVLKVFGPRDDAEKILERHERWKPTLSRVRHDAVARLLDVGLTDEGLVYVASEFISGWPLSAIDDKPSIGAEARVEIHRQLAAAVDAIHAAGAVHLDLEPSNVRVSAATGWQVGLLGFGVRLIVDGLEPSVDADRRALDRLQQILNPLPHA